MKRCCAKGKSHRDDTLLTVGDNLRERGTHCPVPQGRHVAHHVPSLRDWAHLFRKRYRAERPPIYVGADPCVRPKLGAHMGAPLRAESPQTKVGANVLVSPCRGRAREDARPHPKAESPAHISVGQRPTFGMCHAIKAVSLAHDGRFFMCKAFSLDTSFPLLRRALPYANMCKGFALKSGRRSPTLLPSPVQGCYNVTPHA